MKLEMLNVEVKKGRRVQLKSGYGAGLDLPKGKVIISKVANLKNTPKLKEEIKFYLEPLYPTFEDLMREPSEYIKERMEEITKMKDGDWVTFKYTDDELNDLYLDVTIPYAEFVQLIEEK